MLQRSTSCLVAGRFGECWLGSFSHFKVRVKILKISSSRVALTHEASILSKFTHPNLPYLFGMWIDNSALQLVTSFHGFEDQSLSLHSALYRDHTIDEVKQMSIEWMHVSKGLILGLEHKYKIIHNNLKGDNVLLAPDHSSMKAVIIDFGKSCEVSCTRKYTLSSREKAQHSWQWKGGGEGSN